MRADDHDLVWLLRTTNFRNSVRDLDRTVTEGVTEGNLNLGWTFLQQAPDQRVVFVGQHRCCNRGALVLLSRVNHVQQAIALVRIAQNGHYAMVLEEPHSSRVKQFFRGRFREVLWRFRGLNWRGRG